jgi:hypothetical protein
MSISALLIWSSLLQATPTAEPTSVPAKAANETRGVVVDVFADGSLLVSIGDDDYAEKGDRFFLVRGAERMGNDFARAKIVSLGKRYSVVKVEGAAKGLQPEVGDRVSRPDWKERQALLDARMLQGGAILINGK